MLEFSGNTALQMQCLQEGNMHNSALLQEAKQRYNLLLSISADQLLRE